MTTIADPRVWPSEPSAACDASLYRHAEASLASSTTAGAQSHDAAIESRLETLLDGRDGATLATILESAPSAPVYRHLWRLLSRVEGRSDSGTMEATVFALPLIIVAGLETAGTVASLRCVVDDVSEVAELLRQHGALAGNQNFTLANALVAADAIDVRNLPSVHAWRELRADATLQSEPRRLEPAPIIVDTEEARVHLRFVVGAALAADGNSLVVDDGVGRWGMPFTRLLGRGLTQERVTLLVLPKAPKRLCAAVQLGRAAQREVSAQLFASNAIRRIRASVGEPMAVISAHRAPDSVAGGELRVSLASVFDPDHAEGFRCPLYRADRTSDVADMLMTLLHDCRIDNVRVMPGIHPDRDPATGLPLFFRGDAVEISNVSVQ